MHDDDEIIRSVLQARVRGYLLKADARIHLIEAVETLARHEAYISGKVSGTLLDAALSGRMQDGSPLTARERTVCSSSRRGTPTGRSARSCGSASRPSRLIGRLPSASSGSEHSRPDPLRHPQPHDRDVSDGFRLSSRSPQDNHWAETSTSRYRRTANGTRRKKRFGLLMRRRADLHSICCSLLHDPFRKLKPLAQVSPPCIILGDHGSYRGISMTTERVERRRTTVWRLTGRDAPMGADGVSYLGCPDRVAGNPRRTDGPHGGRMAVSCTLRMKRLINIWTAVAVILLVSIGGTAAQPKSGGTAAQPKTSPVPLFVWPEFPAGGHMGQGDPQRTGPTVALAAGHSRTFPRHGSE